ncbi:MAG: hypothetical protein NXI24_24845 [bacterium]|nr:hypothetical protein [bacterium]
MKKSILNEVARLRKKLSEGDHRGRSKRLCLNALTEVEEGRLMSLPGLAKAVGDLPDCSLETFNLAAEIERLVGKDYAD